MPQPLAVTAFMASPGRFELPAPRLGGVCSIQLSYGDIFDFSWSRMERSASQDFDDLIIRRRSLYPFNYENIVRQTYPYRITKIHQNSKTYASANFAVPCIQICPLNRRPAFGSPMRSFWAIPTWNTMSLQLMVRS